MNTSRRTQHAASKPRAPVRDARDWMPRRGFEARERWACMFAIFLQARHLGAAQTRIERTAATVENSEVQGERDRASIGLVVVYVV